APPRRDRRRRRRQRHLHGRERRPWRRLHRPHAGEQWRECLLHRPGVRDRRRERHVQSHGHDHERELGGGHRHLQGGCELRQRHRRRGRGLRSGGVERDGGLLLLGFVPLRDQRNDLPGGGERVRRGGELYRLQRNVSGRHRQGGGDGLHRRRQRLYDRRVQRHLRRPRVHASGGERRLGLPRGGGRV